MTKQGNKLEQYRRYIGVLWDRRQWIYCTWAAALVTALGVAYVLPDTFSSSTMILVERQKVPEDYVRPTVTDPMQERLKTISQQILSRTRIRQIIDEYHLTSERSARERILERLHLLHLPWVQKWGRRLHVLSDPEQPPDFEAAINAFQERVKVQVVAAQAFSVGYVGYDPVTVMRVTNAIADMFITENLKIREARAEGTTEFLNAQLEAARKELEAQEVGVQEFKAKNLGSLPEQLETNLRTLDRLQLELQHADESLAALADQRTYVQRQLVAVEQQIAEMSEDSRAALRRETPLQRQLADAEARLGQLQTKYTDLYPEVLTLKAQIEELRTRVAAAGREEPADNDLHGIPALTELRDQLRQIERDTAEQRANRIGLERDFQDYKRRVEATPGVEQQLQKLSRDYGILQRNYQSLLEKQLNAKLAESLERRQKGEQFLIIDPANLPAEPDGPNRLFIVLAGLMGGLGLGVGVVIGLDELRPRFRTREDVTAILGLPVLTVVPQIKGMQRGS